MRVIVFIIHIFFLHSAKSAQGGSNIRQCLEDFQIGVRRYMVLFLLKNKQNMVESEL